MHKIAVISDSHGGRVRLEMFKRIAEQEKKLVAALKAMLGIYAKVRIVSPKSITRSEGKAVRIIDKRKL